MMKLLTADEVAEILAVDRRTVYRWVAEGHLPAFRLGFATLRFSMEMLEEWVGGHAVGSRASTVSSSSTMTGRVLRLRAAVSSKLQAASVAGNE